MNHVIEVATKFLNQDVYQPRGYSLHSRSIRGRKKKRSLVDSDEESEVEESSGTSSESSDEESSDDEELVLKKKKLRNRMREDNSESESKRSSGRRKDVRRDEGLKEPRGKEKGLTKSEPNIQSNIEDLAERFRQLELKLSKRSNQEPPGQRSRSSLYCIMCGTVGHLVRECVALRFFIARWICQMDLNNRVVMSDGSALPHAEGEGG